jgi:hypothetical protein
MGTKIRLLGWRIFENCWDVETQAEAEQKAVEGTLWPKAKGGKRSKAVVIEAMIAAEEAEEEVAAEMNEEARVDDFAAVNIAMEPEIQMDDEDEQNSDDVDDEDVGSPGEVIDDGFIVEMISKSKVTKAGSQYLVHYKGLARSNDRWFSAGLGRRWACSSHFSVSATQRSRRGCC